MTTRENLELRLEKQEYITSLRATSVSTKSLDAETVSQRTIDYINSGGNLIDPNIIGNVSFENATIPADQIGNDFQNLLDNINVVTFDSGIEGTYAALNNYVGTNARQINAFVRNFYIEFQIFKRGVLARLADIPFSASLGFQMRPRVLAISTIARPFIRVKAKMFWATIKTTDWVRLSPEAIEAIADILGTINPLTSDLANLIRISNFIVPSSVRISVNIGKYNGDVGDVPTNWNALAANATDQDLIDLGWLTDVAALEPIVCTVDTTATVVTEVPDTEFDLPVYEEDSWIQTAFVIAATIINTVASVAGLPIPELPTDAWNGGSFEVDNLAIPSIEIPEYIDTDAMVDNLYKQNASASPMIGDAVELGTIFNDDSWIGFSMAAVNRGSANTIDGDLSVDEFFPPPPPLDPLNFAYRNGQSTGFTDNIGLGDISGASFDYKWVTDFDVRFIDWQGSSYQRLVDPISKGGGDNLVYRYNGTFDRSGIGADGTYLSDPTYNYISVGGRPFIYYQDTPVPATNDRSAIVVLPAS